MLKKDGLTVVKKVMEYDPNAKIILITASDDQKDHQSIFRTRCKISHFKAL